MNLLLDSHVLLWWLGDDPTLGSQSRQVIADIDNMVFVSAASIWEIAIKQSLNKLRLPDDFQQVLANEPFQLLDVSSRHAFALKDLPLLHRDPFDRMLIAQCLVEKLTFLTRDENNLRYEIIRCMEA